MCFEKANDYFMLNLGKIHANYAQINGKTAKTLIFLIAKLLKT